MDDIVEPKRGRGRPKMYFTEEDIKKMQKRKMSRILWKGIHSLAMFVIECITWQAKADI